jgi:hypothetical protein
MGVAELDLALRRSDIDWLLASARAGQFHYAGTTGEGWATAVFYGQRVRVQPIAALGAVQS